MARAGLADESPTSLSGWLFADLFLLLIVVGFAAFNADGNDSRPVVTTEDATVVGPESAILNGRVNAKKLRTEVGFEWGTSPKLDDASQVDAEGSPVSGSEVTSYFSRTLTGLESGKTYFFRAVADNEAGSARGKIFTFTTAEVDGPCTNVGARFEKTPFKREYSENSVRSIISDIGRWMEGRDLAEPRVVVAQISGWTTTPGGAGTIGAARARSLYSRIDAIDSDDRYFYADTALLPIQGSRLAKGRFSVVLYFADFADKCE